MKDSLAFALEVVYHRPNNADGRPVALKVYFVRLIRGMQKFVVDELQQKCADIRILDQEPEHIVFRYAGAPQSLLELRSVDEICLCLRYLRDVDRSRSQLQRIQAAARGFSPHEAMDVAHRFGMRWRGRLRVRVKASMLGRHNFRRVDAQYAVERGLTGRGDVRWELDKEHPHAQIQIEVRDEEAYLLWRLTDESFRQHGEKQAHVPGSLRPSVAYAMVQASRSAKDDVFLDPMCGAGTILLERAHSDRYAYLLGGDISPAALRASQENIGPRHQPCALIRWDARALPLRDHTVDRLVCNPPFGKQVTLPGDGFRVAFLKEARRVIQRDGRMVLLSGDKRSMMAAARKTQWWLHESTTLSLLGQRAFILVFQPR